MSRCSYLNGEKESKKAYIVIIRKYGRLTDSLYSSFTPIRRPYVKSTSNRYIQKSNFGGYTSS